MKKTKKLLCALCALIMALCASLGGAAGAEGSQFSICREDVLIASSGMTEGEWEERILEEKQAGLSAPADENEVLTADPDAVITRRGGKIRMITSSAGLDLIPGAQDAYRTVYRYLALLGAPAEAELRLWSSLTAGNNRIYVFQQVFEGLTVTGSTARLAVGPDGRMRALVSSLSSVLPESRGTGEISSARAEDIVREMLAREGRTDSVLDEYTCRAVVPSEDEESTDAVPDRLAWLVYSQASDTAGRSVLLPCLAHFVGMDGEYIRSCAVSIPGDASARAGYASVYAFEFMERSEWSGTVTDRMGGTREITVPVMRDTRTGAWFLADPERKIAVGDFAALAYGDEEISLVSQSENGPWDDEDLITYANLIRVWDFYASLGWTGPDGEGTPLLLLKNLCDEDGTPIFNAAYIGLYRGWQCFTYGGECYIGQALDVMAHEYTHCVTGTVMNTNLYRDDMGAINEALSDIMGNVCEFILTGKTDEKWLIGEDSGEAFRSMTDPHAFGQPEYVWDIYYAPSARTPSDINDRGGVHANSSILSSIAASLCTREGMSLEKARDFWLTVAFAMTPETDYPGMVSILRWALDECGCGEYRAAADRMIALTRMGETTLPETLAEGQRLVSLSLPDSGLFKEHSWNLFALRFDTQELKNRFDAVKSFVSLLFSPESNGLMIAERGGELAVMFHLGDMDLTSPDAEDLVIDALLMSAADLVKTGLTWQDGDDGSVNLVTGYGPALYCLFCIPEDENEGMGAAVYLDGEWFDVFRLFPMDENTVPDADYTVRFFSKLFSHAANLFLGENSGNESEVLSSEGLSDITLAIGEAEEFPFEEPAV